ncbi:hypothetical protein T484DRAFT_2859463 [Baffinella frigidus]|nr:hypothetical protein T484DRAFT_2859463 [Cryptophyta sp. CCMP2293]
MGITNSAPLAMQPLQPGGGASAVLPLGFNSEKLNATAPPLSLQVAVKTSTGIVYFQDNMPFHLALIENGRIDGSEYPGKWQQIPASNQAVSPLSGFAMDPASVEAKLNGSNVHVLHTKPLPNGRGSALYCSCKTENGVTLLAEVQVTQGGARCAVRCDNAAFSPLLPPALQAILAD